MVASVWVRVLGACVLIVASGARGARGEEAWEAALATEVGRVELVVSEIDGQKAEQGTLAQRVSRVHERLKRLERGLAIQEGSLSGQTTRQALSNDVDALKDRAMRVHSAHAEAKKEQAGPAAPPKPEEPPAPGPAGEAKPKADDPKAAPPPKREFPDALEWKATGALTYTESGEWVTQQTRDGTIVRNFRHTGYEGLLTFSVRASGLKREVKRATLRVAVTLKDPFHTIDSGRRVYEVEWVPKRALGNDALRTWAGHDTLHVTTAPRWLVITKTRDQKLKVEAHVLTITTKDDETVTFEAPTFK